MSNVRQGTMRKKTKLKTNMNALLGQNKTQSPEKKENSDNDKKVSSPVKTNEPKEEKKETPKHIRKLRNKTLKDLQITFINSLTANRAQCPNNKKIDDFEQYFTEIESSLNDYTLCCSAKFDPETDENPNMQYMDKVDIKTIKKVYDLNKSFTNKVNEEKHDEVNMKVVVNNKDYIDPYHSLGIIKHNHFIFDEVSKKFLFRQKDLFDLSIRAAKNYQLKYKTKMPKIQVSGSIPKTNFEIPVVNLAGDRRGLDALPPIPTSGEDGLRLFAYYRYPNKNFPEGREQFSICMCNHDIVISGGMSTNMKNLTIWSLNLEKLEWRKVNMKMQTNNRYGHTTVSYQNKIYIFGGKTKYNSTSMGCGLEIFNCADGTITTPIMGRNTIEPRKNHISVLVGNQILIYGGITDSGTVLNETQLLNLNPLKYAPAYISRFAPGPFLYGHAACLAIPEDILINHKFNIYYYPPMEIGKRNTRIKEKGLYVFGGRTKEGDNGLSNQLWILIMGRRPLEWVRPETKGKPPSPRCFHSMNFFEKGNFLIVHGGRNDIESDTSCLSDTFIFDLENFEWMKVSLYSQIPNFSVLTRCGHQSMIYGNKLIVLGGMNNCSYLGSSLFIINLDFYYTSNMRTSEQIMIQELEKKDIDDPDIKKKLQKLKSDLKKNQLGLVTDFHLPPI